MSRFLAPLPLLALLGCPSGPMDCDLMAIASVVVNVSTSDGEEAAFEISYEADGAAPVACEPLGDGGDQFVCGYEVDGDLTITVEAEGYVAQTETVTVEMREDGCHVVSETLDVVLEPAE